MQGLLEQDRDRGWLSLRIKRLDRRFLDNTMQPKIAEAQKHYEMCKPKDDAGEYTGLHGRNFRKKSTTKQTYPSALKHLTIIEERC